MKHTETYYVKGMHCAACHTLVPELISEIRGVSHVQMVDSNRVQITYKNNLTFSQMNDQLQKYNYSLSVDSEEKSSVALRLFVVVAVVLVGLWLFRRFDISVFNPSLSGGLTPSTAFIFGLIASVSTCFAVTGGLLVDIVKDLKTAQAAKFGALFSGGRLLGYILGGGLLGAIGAIVGVSASFQFFVILGASILLFVIGLQMTQLTTIGSGWQTKLTRKITSHSESTIASGLTVGALTFLLPCGFTQAMGLYALQLGNASVGALLLGSFALGTLPALFLINIIPTLLSPKFRNGVVWVAGILLLIVSISGIISAAPFVFGGSNSLIGANSENTIGAVNTASQGVTVPVGADGVQVISMNVVGYNYQPSSFTIKKGIPVRWEINAAKAAGCAHVLVAPAINVQKLLDGYNTNVVTFTPTKDGTISFTCSMGMTGPGKIIVTD